MLKCDAISAPCAVSLVSDTVQHPTAKLPPTPTSSCWLRLPTAARLSLCQAAANERINCS
jgi:hypothetical protein